MKLCPSFRQSVAARCDGVAQEIAPQERRWCGVTLFFGHFLLAKQKKVRPSFKGETGYLKDAPLKGRCGFLAPRS
jgi:hypothetical protein